VTAALLRACAAWLLLAGAAAAACREDVIDLRGPEGAARFVVEIADDPRERARGLMFRETLGDGEGMLFLWEAAAPRAFWMKNTPLSLDLIFLDARGRVINVIARAEPHSRASLPSAGPALAVLEIRGGLAARYGIGEDAVARHPHFPRDEAAWPCG
jgi:uncharacterized membrane protein (UPF0127 family)